MRGVTRVRAASGATRLRLPRPRRGRHLALSWRLARGASFGVVGWAVVAAVAAASAAGAASGSPPSGVLVSANTRWHEGPKRPSAASFTLALEALLAQLAASEALLEWGGMQRGALGGVEVGLPGRW